MYILIIASKVRAYGSSPTMCASLDEMTPFDVSKCHNLQEQLRTAAPTYLCLLMLVNRTLRGLAKTFETPSSPSSMLRQVSKDC